MSYSYGCNQFSVLYGPNTKSLQGYYHNSSMAGMQSASKQQMGDSCQFIDNSAQNCVTSWASLQNSYSPSTNELIRKDQYRLGIPQVWEDVT